MYTIQFDNYSNADYTDAFWDMMHAMHDVSYDAESYSWVDQCDRNLRSHYNATIDSGIHVRGGTTRIIFDNEGDFLIFKLKFGL